MLNVTVGPEFFAKTKLDYSDWRWAWTREIFTNSIDAKGTKVITLNTAFDGQNTTVTVTNDGEPMSEEILMGKFLTIGASGKDFVGAVGGFGIAKLLIALCHEQWHIRTGTIEASGRGGSYQLNKVEYKNGVTTVITMAGDESNYIVNAAKKFALMTQWNGTIQINGELYQCNMRKGSRRRELDWGVVYTNNSFNNTLVVRIAGIPMFTKSVRYKGTVLVEITGKSGDILTSNRDGLKYQFQNDLDEFVSEIAVDTKSALKDKTKKVERVKFAGYELRGSSPAVGETISVKIGDDNIEHIVAALVSNHEQITEQVVATAERRTEVKATDLFNPQFYLKSEIGGVIPGWFVPGSEFSANSKRLISNWTSFLVELASLTGLDKKFSVGFVFDPECEAQFERDCGQNIVFVNPCRIIEQEGKPRQLKTRWKFDAAGNFELLAVAIHEFIHLAGESFHDERYAKCLTELIGLVMANRTRFTRHFSAPLLWR